MGLTDIKLAAARAKPRANAEKRHACLLGLSRFRQWAGQALQKGASAAHAWIKETGAREGAERVRDIVADLRRLSSEGSGERVAFDPAVTLVHAKGTRSSECVLMPCAPLTAFCQDLILLW